MKNKAYKTKDYIMVGYIIIDSGSKTKFYTNRSFSFKIGDIKDDNNNK